MKRPVRAHTPGGVERVGSIPAVTGLAACFIAGALG